MKSDAIAYAIAGLLFGLIAGWIIGSQQASSNPSAAAGASPSTAASPAGAAGGGRAALVNESEVQALTSVAERETSNPQPRVQLGNVFFDAERYEDAIKWYSDAIALAPNDVDVSTDLGISYYYTNQDLAGASTAWQQVVDLSPDSPEGQAARRALDSLRAAHQPGGAQKPGA
jgi:tetratricopeptide (TPR) repeat protein